LYPGFTPCAAYEYGVTTALTVAAVQYQGVHGDIAASAAEHVRHIKDVHSVGARLIVFPELSLTGYDLSLFASQDAWVTSADPRLEPIREICARTGITAVIGAALRERDGTPRLASLVIGPDGVAPLAFKTHLHGAEQELFVPGAGPTIVELGGVEGRPGDLFRCRRP
jgi:predicted amidohydrolase